MKVGRIELISRLLKRGLSGFLDMADHFVAAG
jgi:hypothetical protein